MLMSAAMRALRGEMPMRVKRATEEPDENFTLRADGRLIWSGAPIACLQPGDHPLDPRVLLLPTDLIEPQDREALRRSLLARVGRLIRERLAPLYALEAAPLRGAARGLAFQLKERLGVVPRVAVRAQLGALDDATRTTLKRLGVRIGVDAVYLPALLKPAAIAFKTILWAAHHDMIDLVTAPSPGRLSIALDSAFPETFYEAIGYRVFGRIAVRADRLDRLAFEARRRARQGPFVVDGKMLSLIGCRKEDFTPLLSALGFRAVLTGDVPRFAEKQRGKKNGRKRTRGGQVHESAESTASPFAKLKELRLVRSP